MKTPTISYCITVCDEVIELKRLYEFLRIWKRPEDEIIIQQDELTKITDDTTELRKFIDDLRCKGDIIFTSFPLNKDFASFKNNLSKFATGDYIFQIDADEVPNINLIQNLPTILAMNPNIDVYLVPRINTVLGLTQEHIEKWRWNINQHGYINFPDYQNRIYKHNGIINWKNKVHEILDGYKQYSLLPTEGEDYCLYHPKTIKKQEAQNNFYATI